MREEYPEAKLETGRKPSNESNLLQNLSSLRQKKEVSQYIPGIQMIKNQLIKPLLFATEKVVEYYFPEDGRKEEVNN